MAIIDNFYSFIYGINNIEKQLTYNNFLKHHKLKKKP